MDLAKVSDLIESGLKFQHDEICKHINTVEAAGRRTGIEKKFAKAFEAQLVGVGQIEHEQPLSLIETQSYHPDHDDGRLDCYLCHEDRSIVFEYKAVRLPRRHSDSVGGALYDVGQLASDYLRLNRAGKLDYGYVIAFVYGPLVVDAQPAGKLYRAFHNQMFVDFSVAKYNHQEDLTRYRRAACRKLAWDKAYGCNTLPGRVSAIEVGSLGAICIDCRD